MKGMYIRRVALISGVLALAAFAVRSMVVPGLDLDALTAESSLIITGEVTSVHETGRSKVAFNDFELDVRVETGTIQVDHVLKGNPPLDGVKFQAYLTDSPIGWASIIAHRYSVFFLKTDTSGNFQFTSPYYPSIPTVPGAAMTGTRTIDGVTSSIKAVLSSSQATSNQKTTTIFILSRSKSAGATAALHEASEDPLREVQLTAAGALLERNDTSGLEAVKEALLHPQSISYVMSHNLIYAISEGLTDTKAIPALTQLVSSTNPEVRRAVASSLMHMESPDAIEPLKSLLDDSDFEARYYAVVGLAQATNQSVWHPDMEGFRANQAKYLEHWRNWTPTR
jgi:hypothetical protein